MNVKNTASAIFATILFISLGMSGPALAGDRHHGGHGHGYGSGHGYNHHYGHRGYGKGYKRHHGHDSHYGYRGYGHRYDRNYGYGGYRYYDDNHDDLLLGLLLGGLAGHALNH